MDGPSVNLWDALAMTAWLAATGLIVSDALTRHGEPGLGPLAPFGGLVALVAVALTTAGIARRAKDEVLRKMDRVFKAGRESVSPIKR